MTLHIFAASDWSEITCDKRFMYAQVNVWCYLPWYNHSMVLHSNQVCPGECTMIPQYGPTWQPSMPWWMYHGIPQYGPTWQPWETMAIYMAPLYSILPWSSTTNRPWYIMANIPHPISVKLHIISHIYLLIKVANLNNVLLRPQK